MSGKSKAQKTIELANSMIELQGFASAMIDKADFSDETEMKHFIIYCENDGFNVAPIEDSPFAIMPLENKLVIWKD